MRLRHWLDFHSAFFFMGLKRFISSADLISSWMKAFLPMTTLRQRMLDDLRIRNDAPSTVRCYVRAAADLSRPCRAVTGQAGGLELRRSRRTLRLVVAEPVVTQ
jgi:hypothetical protein